MVLAIFLQKGIVLVFVVLSIGNHVLQEGKVLEVEGENGKTGLRNLKAVELPEFLLKRAHQGLVEHPL